MKLVIAFLLLLATSLQAQTARALIVSGVSGDPAIATQMQRDANTLRDAIGKRFGGTVAVLAENTTPRSDRASIQQAIAKLASDAGVNDRIIVVLLGHGSGTGDDVRFNIPGPDLTAAELASLLTPLGQREVAVVVATSASGPFLESLKAPNRLVVTATRSASEAESVIFAQHFARALNEDVADTDKDEGVSIKEAYEYARREVERTYQQQNRLATEHAQVSDSVRAAGFVLRSGAPGPAVATTIPRPTAQPGPNTAPRKNALRTMLDAQRAKSAELVRARLDALDDSIAARPNDDALKIRLGRLFLEKYNAPEALKLFNEILKRNPRNADALLGSAEALEFLNEEGAMSNVRAALAADPKHLGAHAYLARTFVDSDQLDSARIHVAAANATAPNSVEAIIAAGELAQAQGKRGDVEQLRSRLRNKTEGAQFNVALAELSVKQRQYAQAVRLASDAIAADSSAWQAYAIRGINELRVGNTSAARNTLERAFAGDPFNVWVKNTLDLLDRLETFESRNNARFSVIAAERDADVLTPYIQELGAEAFAKMKQRYGYEPSTPVRLEVYDRHADFSVRTVGLAGLGALGVSFGSVLAMDSPAARDPSEFVWGSTFWHELAHAFHLGMTEQRVPRWFTEGLAVLEERQARRGWGEEGLPAFERAHASNRLLRLAQLNGGFTRPSYPSQIIVSYYQASLVLEMIEQTYGATAMRDMLNAYRSGKSTDDAFQSVLHRTSAQLDTEFQIFLREWQAGLPRRKAAVAATEYDALVKEGTMASLELALYTLPYDPAVHVKLAELSAAAGNWPKAIRERRVIVALKPVDMAEARYQLALAFFNGGDNKNAREEVVRALEIAPSFRRAQELLQRLPAGAVR
ncbi:MAG TPA: hypothetical protein VM100_09465 [Longimicrobiales bacterium]|nr:hypothetical protein [Longimicrobiales bacterium]